MKNQLATWRYLFLAFFLSLTLAPPVAADPGAAEAGPGTIASLAVMPFGSAEKPFDKALLVKDMVDCKIFGFCAWKKEDAGAGSITAIYQRHLRQRMGDVVLPWEQVEQVFDRMPPRGQETLRSAAKRFGEATAASHVLTGTVWRYRERAGSAVAAEVPASVNFTAILVRTRDGAVLWSGHFDKTQRGLAENLLDAPLFVKKGVKWLSAEELASFGVEETLKSFPAR